MAGRFSDSAWHRKPATSRRSVRVLLLVLGLAIAGLIAGPLASAIQSGLSPTSSPARVTESGLTSWNPHVSCSADLVTIRDVLGPAYPTQTVNGSRYQTNSTAGGIPQERALSPPCTITNKTGTVLSSFVQINGVSLYGSAEPRGHRWQCPGHPDLAGSRLGRRISHHELQDLSGSRAYH